MGSRHRLCFERNTYRIVTKAGRVRQGLVMTKGFKWGG
jgi:hypothetical protein